MKRFLIDLAGFCCLFLLFLGFVFIVGEAIVQMVMP